MDWIWPLYQPYVAKLLSRANAGEESEERAESTFYEVLSASTVTVLVQEPHRGSVRFKCLARYPASQSIGLLRNPSEFLASRFGGGKFKLNFHHGWNFVATRNFKPAGEPRWKELPALDPDSLS